LLRFLGYSQPAPSHAGQQLAIPLQRSNSPGIAGDVNY
jgi:hypothetical protein